MADKLNITSSSFGNNQTIPKKYGFNGWDVGGENISPNLKWSGAPSGTKSFVVTIWDPDAPTTVGYWHWLVFNIPANVTELEEGKVPAGAVQGYTDYGMSAYGGPAPPPGDSPHHYRHRVFALDVDKLPLEKGTTGATLMFMMRGHILAEGELVGLFSR
ncbi:MAG TPA: YbhB/YbcL family Raf kinase inhibitor-like protein [Candidatus Baltobacteraceae bacterium]